MPRLLSFLLAAPALLLGPAVAAFTTVGPQATCAYLSTENNPIQLALNDGHTEIRIVGGQSYNGSLVIGGDADVVLRGGYADCTAAAAGQLPAVPARSVVVASAAPNAAVAVPASASRRRQVTLDLIEIRPNPEFHPTGSGLVVAGLLDLRLQRARISGFDYNAGSGGGAIVVTGLLWMQQSEISSNRALSGGGIYCSEGTVWLDAASRVMFNEAYGAQPNGRGGGALLDHCRFESEGRVLPATLGGTSGVIGNVASREGGGLAVLGGVARFRGGPFCSYSSPSLCQPRLATLAANRSGLRGGGAFLAAGAEAEFDFTQVLENEAASSGGGIHLEGGSTLRFGGYGSIFPGYDRSFCPEGICELMSGNRTRIDDILTGDGGGIRVIDSSLTLADVLLLNHSALDGNVLLANGTSTVLLHQVLVRQDDPAPRSFGRPMIALANQSSAAIHHATLSSELSEPGLIELRDTASLSLNRSVLAAWLPAVDTLRFGAGNTLQGGCNTSTGQTAHAILVGPTVDAADFEAGTLKPAGGSVLLDACVSEGVLDTAVDVLGQPRVAAQAPESTSALDIGAYERPGYRVFADGLE